MEDLERELLDLEPGQTLEKGRPAFLSGLCITSWAGCGFLLIFYTWQLIMYSSMSTALMDMSVLITTILIDIAGIFFVAGGVLGMWKLKRWGFFVYLVGELAPIFSGLFMLYNPSWIGSQDFSLDGIQNWVFSTSGILGVWVPVVFITAYATHFKFMK